MSSEMAARPRLLGSKRAALGQAEPSCDIANRLRAAVASRGFEPCPPSTDEVASCAGQPGGQAAVLSAHETAASEHMNAQAPGEAKLCHPESEAGVFSSVSSLSILWLFLK